MCIRDRLDTVLTGLGRGDLIILAARPGMGKTSFADVYKRQDGGMSRARRRAAQHMTGRQKSR